MAIIECHECKVAVSDQATACPHCGAPSAKGQNREDYERDMRKAKSKMGVGCAMILAAPVIILVGVVLFAIIGWVFG